jgi:DNA-binding transcriptional LysR family regulator
MDAMMGTLEFVAATDWVAVLPFVMMASDIDRDRFEIRPLADPPLYSDFILIEPSRKLMTPAAALFASVLKSEAERSTELFRERVAPQICS